MRSLSFTRIGRLIIGFVAVMPSMGVFANPALKEEGLTPISCAQFCSLPVRPDAFDHVDLRIGQSRLKQAELDIQRLHKSFSSDVSSSVSASFERMSENDRFPIFNENPYRRLSLGTSMSYDPDLFEKRADKVQRSTILREKMEVDLDSIRARLYFQSLIAYVQFAQANFEIRLLERSLSHARQRIEIIKKQIDLGLRAQSALSEAEDSINDVAQRLQTARSMASLESLVFSRLYGSDPDFHGEYSIQTAWVRPEFKPENLLQKPPLSIRKPILDLEVAFVERLIHEKSASPDIYLAADLSLASLLLGTLISPSSLAWSVGPRLQYVKKPDHEVVTALHAERIREAVFLMESSWKDLAFELDRHRLRLLEIQSAIEQEELMYSTVIKRSAASRLRFETGSSDMADHMKDLVVEDLKSIDLSRQRTRLTLEVIKIHWLLF